MARIEDVMNRVAYKTEIVDGLKGRGLMPVEGNIKLCIYESYIIQVTEDEAVEFINRTIEEAQKMSSDNIYDGFVNTANLRARIAKAGSLPDDVVQRKTRFEGIVEYLVSIVSMNGGDGSIKIKKEHVSQFDGKTEDELFKIGEDNIFKELDIADIGDMIPLPFLSPFTMLVVTNKGLGVCGAAQILNPALPEIIKEKTGWEKAMIIPSSIHEVIVINGNDVDDNEYVKAMIGTVNANELKADEILGDMPYDLY